MDNFLRKIFSVTYNGVHKEITILGIKIKLFSQKLMFKHVLEMKSNIIASKIHSNLEKYRGCYDGRDIVIVGCGPTLEYFEPIKNAIYIGINRAFKFDKVNFNYLFASDNFPEGMNDFIEYNMNTCDKFITYWNEENNERVRQADLIKIKNFQYVLWGRNNRMPMDISLEPFGAYNYFSTSSVATQFALYTLPKRIYLVGMDCTINNIYRNTPPKFFDGTYHNNVKGWIALKEDINDKYPDIEIISINPVGLKGLFKDVYTQSYLDMYPELKDKDIDILGKRRKQYAK